MSLGQLSSRGKQNNKLYQITVTLNNNVDGISFSFYSTRKIDTFSKLIGFVTQFFTNQVLYVFGGNYVYLSSTLRVPISIKYYTDSLIRLNFYNGSVWTWTSFGTNDINTFSCVEV